jgi:large subunit ribosomal protein L10
MERVKKEQVVAEIKEFLSGASSCIAMNFGSVPMTTFTPVRKECAKSGVRIIVVKNTLAKIAVQDTAYAGLSKLFKGMTSLVVTTKDDQTAGAKILKKYVEKDKGFVVKGGMIDGRFLTPQEVKLLSEMPGKTELQAKLLGTMKGVPQKFVCLLAAVPQSFLRVLVAYKDKKEKGN